MAKTMQVIIKSDDTDLQTPGFRRGDVITVEYSPEPHLRELAIQTRRAYIDKDITQNLEQGLIAFIALPSTLNDATWLFPAEWELLKTQQKRRA